MSNPEVCINTAKGPVKCFNGYKHGLPFQRNLVKFLVPILDHLKTPVTTDLRYNMTSSDSGFLRQLYSEALTTKQIHMYIN